MDVTRLLDRLNMSFLEMLSRTVAVAWQAWQQNNFLVCWVCRCMIYRKWNLHNSRWYICHSKILVDALIAMNISTIMCMRFWNDFFTACNTWCDDWEKPTYQTDFPVSPTLDHVVTAAQPLQLQGYILLGFPSVNRILIHRRPSRFP